jgi:hypothetical protein
VSKPPHIPPIVLLGLFSLFLMIGFYMVIGEIVSGTMMPGA